MGPGQLVRGEDQVDPPYPIAGPVQRRASAAHKDHTGAGAAGAGVAVGSKAWSGADWSAARDAGDHGHAVLVRHGMHRLVWLDRPSGTLVHRYERARPGELVHVDMKKLGRIRDGGGWRVHGRDSAQSRLTRSELSTGRRVGFDYVHCAVGDHTRLAYAEIHPDETADRCCALGDTRLAKGVHQWPARPSQPEQRAVLRVPPRSPRRPRRGGRRDFPYLRQLLLTPGRRVVGLTARPFDTDRCRNVSP